jgi:hypothetical protein
VAANYAGNLSADSATLRLLSEGVQLAAFRPTARMLLRELPPTSSIRPAMTQHTQMVRSEGAYGAYTQLGGKSCQRNALTLRAVQVGDARACSCDVLLE